MIQSRDIHRIVY